MSPFSPDHLRALAEGYATLQGGLDALAESYAFFSYKTPSGREYATHGFLRRFNTMRHCIERVFAILPPEQDQRPSDAVLFDATIFLQAFIMKLFGALDNLAWIWVSEKPLRVGRRRVGLGPRCEAVRGSFSQEMREVSAEKAQRVLGWTPRPITETVLDNARSLQAGGLV